MNGARTPRCSKKDRQANNPTVLYPLFRNFPISPAGVRSSLSGKKRINVSNAIMQAWWLPFRCANRSKMLPIFYAICSKYSNASGHFVPACRLDYAMHAISCNSPALATPDIYFKRQEVHQVALSISQATLFRSARSGFARCTDEKSKDIVVCVFTLQRMQAGLLRILLQLVQEVIGDEAQSENGK